ncbi:DUF4397 domain-containing protein [Muricauda sp. JGD-17]|uniref:DUF4397 domain-containing protein n=1 Tax=Flagellimonas ochracea TaxID=2696472 RepID=A0A964TAR8_9FLAO|nr:DUF4397 domain-containing protein [Allomuricauda ochracea]NAY91422.1 DUF4397 domain-containing protein [Allomuricauda ochracea]
MKNPFKFLYTLLVGFFLLSACSEDDSFPQVASLKVVHAGVNVPTLHVLYTQFSEDFTFANNPVLSFAGNERYPVNADRENPIAFVNSTDTTSTVLSTNVNLPSGNISTLFLTGRDSNLSGLLLEDELLRHRDSTAGFRFINLAPDSQSLTFEADQGIGPVSLGFEEATAFQEVGATAANASYNFEIKNGAGDVLTTYATTAPVFKNTTLVIIGLVDDGSGGNSLQVIRVDSF